MANTATQRRVEEWVREEYLRQIFRKLFTKQRLRLISGGRFEFDGVSADRRIVATISTSRESTASGRRGAGKMNKIRSDILFLSLVRASRRVVVLTEPDMFHACQRQKAAGRLPKSVDFLLAKLPRRLAANLRRARRRSSSEVSPGSR
jgi:hypothetical protein